MILQTTLCLAAAAVLINFWLGMRCGQVRVKAKIGVGDGGNEQLLRRMRAQSNFIEQVPLTLMLYGLVEATTKAPSWLVYLGAAFLLGRVAHAFGMDSADGFKAGRPIGMVTGMALQAVLVVLAVMIALARL